ncbi:MAG: hypothetical protein HWQ44_22330 [Nostoc sp. JL34]|nr:hypothetical protein [Nostoc sp. JL34]MBN3885586.1 hypothetical protein [Nostoc sp. JL34]
MRVVRGSDRHASSKNGALQQLFPRSGDRLMMLEVIALQLLQMTFWG